MKKSENYNEYKIKILNNIALNEKEKENIENNINSIDEQIKRLNKEKMQFQQLIDYNNLKEKGFSNDKICEFWKEDEKFIDETEQFVEQYLKYKNTMFGYPANMLHRSGTTEYLRYLESKMYLINNCGDPNETGNYKMDSKKVELKIIAPLIFGLASKISSSFMKLYTESFIFNSTSCRFPLNPVSVR